MKKLNASAKQITDSRRLLQNPYAYLAGSGALEAEIVLSIQKINTVLTQSQRKKMDTPSRDALIEHKARNLQAEIWKDRERLFPEGAPADPVQLLDPSLAIRYIGYEYSLADDLGDCWGKGSNSGIAGIIDRLAKRISISREFSSDIRRFTAAHELGHAILHEGTRMHRDRPIDGSIKSHLPRSPIELEADKFASFFLMPGKLVRERFRMIFGGSAAFVLTDDTAFALDPSNPGALIGKCRTTRDLSRVLAKGEQYNGRQFRSLATQFGVSIETMAIRIEELRLVEAW